MVNSQSVLKVPLLQMRDLLAEKGGVLKVWLCMLDDAEREGLACISQRNIARKTGLCVNTVSAAIRVLEDRGIITWVDGEGTETRTYVL
jgi:DNA-binding MarR family transcriptional regulator